MTGNFDDYCKIFVNAPSAKTVINLLSGVTGGTFEGRTMEIPTMVIDVLQNPDAGMSDDFVTWPVMVEIEKLPEAQWEDYIADIRKTLVHLWENEASAVAACDFEHELPWDGGISRVTN
ncbi:hypothetical protein ABZ686_04575 [Streptomyces sp. NPDC006992]|uniref:hypothetical protein n=1 Tax=Streptomyces sp. NPDC006992 TaxID=3155601 RepID=UPI0033EBF2A3